jgi:hypothetical protein
MVGLEHGEDLVFEQYVCAVLKRAVNSKELYLTGGSNVLRESEQRQLNQFLPQH